MDNEIVSRLVICMKSDTVFMLADFCLREGIFGFHLTSFSVDTEAVLETSLNKVK